MIIMNKKKIYDVNGFIGTRQEICDHFNVNSNTIYYIQNDKKLSFEDAINKRLEDMNNSNLYVRNKVFTINGVKGSIKQICDYFDISYINVIRYINYYKKKFYENKNSNPKLYYDNNYVFNLALAIKMAVNYQLEKKTYKNVDKNVKIKEHY